MSGLIDTHCHLDMLEDCDGALQAARDQKMKGVITIGTRWSRIQDQTALLEKDAADLRIWATLGVHPCHAHEEALPSLEEMRDKISHPAVKGIGESGLDYLPRTVEHKDIQIESFRRHIAIARELQKPLVIHTRDADEDTARILEEESAKGAFPFLLHCFTSGDELARKAVELGGYISFSGILTFPKSERLRALAARLPKSRLLIETDSPYLAPVPHRGKKNMPSLVRHTAECLAQAIGLSVDETIKLTHDNAVRLFNLD